MTLEEIMAKLEANAYTNPPATTKIAAAAPTAPAPEDTLLAAVREISEKTASDLDELSKIASDVAEAESAAMLEQAKLAGVALCDGFMERMASYEDAVSKTAGVNDVEKIAAAAYAKGREDLEKEAEDAYAQGHEEALQEIHKVATEIHLAGQQAARNVLAALQAKRPQG